MKSSEDKAAPSPAPRGGLQLMALILIVLAGLAVYSNVQKGRRDQIETVTITPTTSRATSPTPGPPPAAQ